MAQQIHEGPGRLRILCPTGSLDSLPLDTTGFGTDHIRNSQLDSVKKIKSGLLVGLKKGVVALARESASDADVIDPRGWVVEDASGYPYDNLRTIATRKVQVLPLGRGVVVKVNTLKEGVEAGEVYAVADVNIKTDETADSTYKIRFVGGGGSGARATGTLDFSEDAGLVKVTVIACGTGYTSAPTIELYKLDSSGKPAEMKTKLDGSPGGKVTGAWGGAGIYVDSASDSGKPSITETSNGKVGRIGSIVYDDCHRGMIPRGFVRILMD